MIRTNAGSMKLLWMSMLLAVLATVALTGWAQPAGGRGGSPMEGAGRMLMASPERIDRGVDRLLDKLDATEAQRTQIKAIAQAAAKDLRAQMDTGRGLREKGRALFTAPTVDEAAVEALRQDLGVQHEAISRRISQALVDAAKVLTPQQRTQLAERFEKHHRGRTHGRMHGELGAVVPMS